MRLQQRVKELEVKLQREAFNARQAEERLENSKSAFIESEQNAKRLQLQNNALLAERVDPGVCRMAVEAHGGRIDVNSEEGKGSTFVVSLPLRDE